MQSNSSYSTQGGAWTALLGHAGAEELDEDFERLKAIFGTDHGIFVLAIHSFIEKVLFYSQHLLDLPDRRAEGNQALGPSFADLAYAYRAYLAEKKGFLHEWGQFNAIASQHVLTNAVRHRFERLSSAEAEAAIVNLRAFCRASGISSALLTELELNVEHWHDRTSILDLRNKLKNYELHAVKASWTQEQAAKAIEEAQALRQKIVELEEHGRAKEGELEKALQTAADRDKRVDKLRQEMHEKRRELDAASKKLAQHEAAEKRHAEEKLLQQRLSSLTRTRREFERSLRELTEEQTRAAERITGSGDFLVRGGAGTGKTMVLLEGLRRSQEQTSLAFDGEHGENGGLRDGLLTFSRTLVKYNSYISSVLRIAPGQLVIDTVDAFLHDTFGKQFEGWQFFYARDHEDEKLLAQLLSESGFAAELPRHFGDGTSAPPAAGAGVQSGANQQAGANQQSGAETAGPGVGAGAGAAGVGASGSVGASVQSGAGANQQSGAETAGPGVGAGAAGAGPAAKDSADAGSVSEVLTSVPPATRRFPLGIAELLFEFSEFIWANGVSRQEYVEEQISRAGLKHKLGKEDRALVWDLMEQLYRRHLTMRRVPRNLACIMMLDKLDGGDGTAIFDRAMLHLGPVGSDGAGGAPELTLSGDERAPHLALAENRKDALVFKTLYLDEVQDLPPVVLRLLRRLCERLVMAGDSDQTIFGLRSPFARAGLDIRGRTSVLSTNFRTTQQMASLASKFRELAWDGAAEAANPSSYRSGPSVGWYRAAEAEGLSILSDRLLSYTQELGYDPENICILCPTNRVIAEAAESVRAATGLETFEVKQQNFDFLTSPGIRVCTLHSAKGLDFPVVLLYLPFLWVSDSSSDQTQIEQRRSLLYVALTRAMDHLDVITGPGFGLNRPEKALLEALESAAGGA